MDYNTHIDPETWAFIEATATHYPPDTVDMTVAQQRAIYEKMCRAFHRGYPKGIAAQDQLIRDVPIRAYSGPDPATVEILYFHGGGYVVGGLESHDDICAEICARTGFAVCSVDYRLAPEHKHPAMFEDCLAVAMDRLAATDRPLLLCGDSAGGNLAAAVAHALRGQTSRIKGQVLIYPSLGGDMDAGSYLIHAEAPMLRRDELLFYRDIRLSGPEPVGDPSYAPLHDTSFVDLPPTVIITAECDPLADDGKDYCAAIKKAGGRAQWFNEIGLVHGYLRARHTVHRAKASFDRIVTALAALGAGRWPYD